SLVLLAPFLVEPDYPLGGVGEARLAGRGDSGLAGLHALVARDDQRLGLGVLPLAQQAAGEQAAGVEGGPLVPLDRLADAQALAQDGLGLGPFPLLDEAQAQGAMIPAVLGWSAPNRLRTPSRPARNSGSASAPRPDW